MFIKLSKFVDNNPLTSALLIFGVLSCLYVGSVFSHLDSNEFLLIHDHLIWLNQEHLNNESYIRLKDSGGISFGIQSAMSLFNKYLYAPFLASGLNIKMVEMVVFTFFLFVFQFLSFTGLWKVFKYIDERRAPSFIDVFIPTMFFCWGPLAYINMNTGNFWSLNFILSYVSLPFLIYETCLAVENGWNAKNILGVSILLFLSFTYIPFFIPSLMCLAVILVAKFGLSRIVKNSWKALGLVAMIFTLLSTYLIFIYLFEIHFNIANAISVGLRDSTAGSISGGMLTILLNWFSWVVYSDFSPRSILSFAHFMTGPVYILSILTLYVAILSPILRIKELCIRSVPFLLMLLSSLFFAKGANIPFGGIYTFLLNNFPPFLTVRSPDNKFALGVVFSTATLIFIALNYFKTHSREIWKQTAFRILIVSVILSVCYPLLSLKAMLGENIPGQSGQFKTQYYPEYKEVVELINSDPESFNVLIYPPSSLPNLSHNKSIFIGKDLLGSFSTKPFLYLSYQALTPKNYYDLIKNTFKGPSVERIQQLGVGYVIIRKDAYKDGSDDYSFFESYLNDLELVDLVKENQYLKLYRVRSQYFKGLLNTNTDAQVTMLSQSPVSFRFRMSGLKDTTSLVLSQSFNKFFQLFIEEYDNEVASNFLGTPRLSLPRFDSQELEESGVIFNSWDLDPGRIKSDLDPKFYKLNQDGSLDLIVNIYFTPQVFFYISCLVTAVILTLSTATYAVLVLRKSRSKIS